MEIEFCFMFIIFSTYIQWVYALTNDNNSLIVTTEINSPATTQSYRLSRAYRREQHNYDHHMEDDYDNNEDDEMEDSKSLSQAKNENWGGYYDFLINEGSYKFWALATAALLIYSGFAALYYAKVNSATTDDYEDYFLRRKRRDINNLSNNPSTIFGIDMATFQRIIDSIERQN
ncbi:hypothetical protein PV325_006046 [Microctonus aethiopoides]|uniref:Uncharacterized protein n=1 Tax=Microctonus aethiopoides TaxID=144406 RepID=A0AA39FM86_9HYME|nr:hypothetical protein PV325_006046 [Microctonus aethiopoides]KAK0172202.1 hypothetical protein PV328_005549 [Microctonus aethiopoides]